LTSARRARLRDLRRARRRMSATLRCQKGRPPGVSMVVRLVAARPSTPVGSSSTNVASDPASSRKGVLRDDRSPIRVAPAQ
jgi:hypothetical protein